MDYRERAAESTFFEFQNLERAPFGLVLDRQSRHDRDAESDFDRPLDGLDIVELERVLRLDAVIAQDPIGRLAGWYIAFEADKALAFELTEAHLGMLRQRIVGRHHQHQLVVTERNRHDLAAL